MCCFKVCDSNFEVKCLFNCWSLLIYVSSATLVHIVKCKVVVLFVATFKI